jgi:hypothetical protein
VGEKDHLVIRLTKGWDIFSELVSKIPLNSSRLEGLGGRRFPEGDHVRVPKVFFEESIKC